MLHITRNTFQLSKGTPFVYLQIKKHIDFIAYQASFINTEPQLDTINALYLNDIEIICKGFYDKFYFKLFKHISRHSAKCINEYIQENQISIVHFHYGSDATIYMNLIKILKVPFIVSFYGYDCTSFPTRYFSFGKFLLKQIVFKHSGYLLAMSPDMKNDLIKLGCDEKKILVHYFGNEIDKFVCKNRNYNKQGPLKLLIMASLFEKKGHLFLLKSLVKLNSFHIQYKLTIVGQGPLEKKIKDFVLENHLSNNVEFKKNIPYGTPEMINEYLSADIYLQPSVTTKNNEKEGIPGALIEAMATGLPVISTYHAGITYVVKNNETGLLINEWEVDRLSERILTLLTHPALREKLGRSAQAFVLNELDCNIKAKELENIYLKAIGCV